jgi:hypothetical protein
MRDDCDVKPALGMVGASSSLQPLTPSVFSPSFGVSVVVVNEILNNY